MSIFEVMFACEHFDVEKNITSFDMRSARTIFTISSFSTRHLIIFMKNGCETSFAYCGFEFLQYKG